METLRAFKARLGVQNEKIQFFSSKTSNRKVGSLGNFTLITTKDFNPSEEVYVCDPPKGFACDPNTRFLTNKSGTAVFEL